MAKFELGEKTSTLGKLAVQPVPVSMFVGTHPFVRLSDNCATKAVVACLPGRLLSCLETTY